MMFGSVQQAFDLGAVGVGATVYWGAQESRREMQEVAEAFEEAHQLGMFTVLWCYVRNSAFKKDGVNYEVSADLTGQANHLGVTIHADIIKQKLPENNGGFPAIGFGATSKLVYSDYTTDNPIDLARWQVVNNYMGRIPADQQRRGVLGRGRHGSGRADRRHQQAGRRSRAHHGPQGLPAPYERRRGHDQRRPGRLRRHRHHHRLAGLRP